MDTLNAEFGLAHVVKSPGYVGKTSIYEKVDGAEPLGIVRRVPSPVPSIFFKPQSSIFFELFVDGRLCMVRGMMSKEMMPTDSDVGYVRDNHVWLIFSSKIARCVSIDFNPTPGRNNIWLRPEFGWDHCFSVGFNGEKITEPTASLMDSLAHIVTSVVSENHLDALTLESSRLRSLFVDEIINNGATEMPDIKLPLARVGAWNMHTVHRCWSQAKLLVDPLTALSYLSDQS